ncbi:MAG TPA: hypothetical protein DCY79_10390 [Planctomycetaceae bacterium]|nr:hypothetical protein [Planctomycetaceae bacterium]
MSLRYLPVFSLLAAITLAPQFVLLDATTQAANRGKQQSSAVEALVQEALHRSVYGLDDERDALLQQAIAMDPDYAPARWHLGYVRAGKQWVPNSDAVAASNRDHRVKAYEHKREQAKQTVADQMHLARWCTQRGLHDQARAHWMQLLQLDPNHSEARRQLGFRRVGRDWVTEESWQAASEKQVADQANLHTWRARMESLRKLTQHRSQFHRNKAAEAIRSLDDTSAIPALEAVFFGDTEANAKLAVEAVGNMTGEEAVMSLVRFAIYSDFLSVRDMAIERLDSHNHDYFVPQLVAEMYSPVTTQTDVTRGRGGSMLVRHAFVREGQNRHELLVLDTDYQRASREGGNRDESLRRAIQTANTNVEARENAVNQQNAMTMLLNHRIANVLNEVTGQKKPANPESWWQWLNEENEVFVAGNKPTDTVYRQTEVAIVDRVAPTGGGAISGGGMTTMDCLAPGTPVWTASGARPIEEIQVGDLVLAQHPETGELTFKPVLDTTIRPESQLIRIYAGQDSFETSGGHLFWVLGEGWVKSRKLQPGMKLQTSQGPLTVSSVSDGTRDVTHNLVVDGFHTYFVGADRILSHDNTIHQATDLVVPGLVQK